MKLIDYRTGKILREASNLELEASEQAAKYDGGAGVIQTPDYGDTPVYVEGVKPNRERDEMKQKSWYYRPTAGHETHGQGVVVDEATGRDVAVVYDGDEDGAMLASAPEMLAALTDMLEVAETVSEFYGNKLNTLNMAKQAIKKARGEG